MQLNLVINCPPALKYLSASTEDDGWVFRQIFRFLNTLGHRFYVVSIRNAVHDNWLRDS